MLRNLTILTSAAAAILAALIFSILMDQNKAYLLSQKAGLNSTGGYFYIHRHLTYEAAIWRAQQRNDFTVYVLGDSITAGLDVSQLSSRLLNFGVSGERIDWLTNDIDQLHALESAQCILITLGVNDLASLLSIEKIRDKYASLLGRLPSTPALIVGEVLPTAKRFSDNHPGAAPARITAFNSEAREICQSLDHCRIGSWAEAFAKETRSGTSSYYMADGLHLSTEGYAAWRRLIGEALTKHGCI